MPRPPSDQTSPPASRSAAGQELPSWHVLRYLKRFIPASVTGLLVEFKRRTLSRKFPRGAEFPQSPEDRAAGSSISIIVAIHDAPLVTARCLASLEKFAPEAETILVDDGSLLEATAEVIRRFSSRPGWKVIRHEKALGHTEACRAGARLATRPYLCLLNSDTVVTPWCWRPIRDAFEHDPAIGVAGPSTTYTGNPQALALPEFLSVDLNDSQICAFARQWFAQQANAALADLEWVAGCAFFIRRDLWEQLGGFDPHLPDYGNEIELCRRVAARRLRVVWVRPSYIHHFGRQSYRGAFGDDGIRERIRAAELYSRQKESGKS